MWTRTIWIAAATALVARGAPAQEGETVQQHTLPADPKAAVVVLDYRGGFGPPRASEEPYFQVLADGTVILGNPHGQRKRVESKISAASLQGLLRYILDEQQFARFDPKAVAAAIAAKEQAQAQAGPGGLILVAPRVADAATTIVRVQADGKTYEAQYYALEMVVRQHPEIRPLAQLEAVVKRLRRGESTIYAGGTAGLAKHLQTLNAQLKLKAPDAPPLRPDDVTAAFLRADGTFWLNATRSDPLPDGSTRAVSGTLSIPPAGEPQINVGAFVQPKPNAGALLPPGAGAGPAAGPGAGPRPGPALPRPIVGQPIARLPQAEPPAPAEPVAAGPDGWFDLFSKEAWYKGQAGQEQSFVDKLEAIPGAGGPSTLQRTSYYKFGPRTIYTGAKRVAALDKLVGQTVELRGKLVDFELEGTSVSEVWPAAVRAAPPGAARKPAPPGAVRPQIAPAPAPAPPGGKDGN